MGYEVSGGSQWNPYLNKSAALISKKAKRNIRIDWISQLRPTCLGQELGTGDSTDRGMNSWNKGEWKENYDFG